MSYTDIEQNEQDDLQLRQKIFDFNRKNRPFRFIGDINQKLQQVQKGKLIDGLPEPSLRKIPRSEELPDRDMPTLTKFPSLNQKNLLQINQKDQDPEATVKMFKTSFRKKLTIQKKQSDDDPLQGQGVIKLRDGAVIFGIWKDGAVVGQGKIVYPSGNYYVGQMKYNLKHGKGVYVWNNGHKYEGDFKNGKVQGFGILYDSFGEIIHQGIWSQGKLIQIII